MASRIAASREAADERAAELSGLERMTRESACNLYKILPENKDWHRGRSVGSNHGNARHGRSSLAIRTSDECGKRWRGSGMNWRTNSNEF